MLATADGHPRAIAYISRIPAATLHGIEKHPFYAALRSTQAARRWPRTTAAQFTAAAAARAG